MTAKKPPMVGGYWYLATPYSKFPGGHEAAFKAALEQCALLNRAGRPTFSPIVHSHLLVVHGGMEGQTDFAAWREFDEYLLAPAAGLIVCTLDGWHESVGVKAEVTWFKRRRPSRPVLLMFPGDPDNLEPLTDELKFGPPKSYAHRSAPRPGEP